MSQKPLAVVTGASTGIGYELAKCCARAGFDLIVAADEPQIIEAARDFSALGAQTEAVEADLATSEGVAKLYAKIAERPVDALLANAGRGLSKGFLDQDFSQVRHVIDTNVTGTLELIQKVGRDMRKRGKGRILITGSIAGFMPGAFHAVYNASKAFLELVLIRPARRGQGHWDDGYVSHAGGDGDGLLRAGRSDRHQARAG